MKLGKIVGYRRYIAVKQKGKTVTDRVREVWKQRDRWEDQETLRSLRDLGYFRTGCAEFTIDIYTVDVVKVRHKALGYFNEFTDSTLYNST